MANNYIETSFEIPKEWPEGAKKDFLHAMLALGCYGEGDLSCKDNNWVYPDYLRDEYLLTEYKIEINGQRYDTQDENIYKATVDGEVWAYADGSVGFYCEEYFDEDAVATVLQMIADRYKIPRRHSVSYSYACTCSKPRVDEFGGGSNKIWCRETQPIVPCNGMLVINKYWDTKAKAMLKNMVALMHLHGDVSGIVKSWDLPDGWQEWFFSLQNAIFPELVVKNIGELMVVQDTEWWWPRKIEECIRLVRNHWVQTYAKSLPSVRMSYINEEYDDLVEESL